jgi:PKD repeat protein
VHVAWDDGSNYGGSGSDDDIFYKYKPAGSSWSTTEVVSTESTDNSWWVSLMVGSDSIVHVSWQDWTNYGGSGSDRDVFYKYKTSPLIADAHGPYNGTEGEPVSFTGSATGGAPPYSWHWNFGDGYTSDEQNPEHIYLGPGNFTVTLTVTDDSSSSSSDTTWADILSGNGRPDIPTITGPASGKPKTAYPYEFRTSDPDGDYIFYYIDWGDNTSSGWLGPYTSGQPITVNHTWSKKGTYAIKAKAKDDKGAESWDWRTLEVSIPRMGTQLILRLLGRFLNTFPILRHLVGL